MNHEFESSTETALPSLLVRGGLAMLILLAWLTATASGQSQVETSGAGAPIHVKHVLGFEGVRRNAGGELSIQNDDVCFQRKDKPAAQVSMNSVRNIVLGEEDKQVGGVPMMLGKTAVPFGGGRVVSLFSHKKYDSLTIEYVDSSGGFHGAVFRLAKGQGQIFKNAFAGNAHETSSGDPASPPRPAAGPEGGAPQWSVQVDRVDPGDTTLAPSFADAIYENILQELSKSKQFQHVFRSGDGSANDDSSVLVLKTLVEKYSAGSETRRAVTTIAGATRVNVRIQLLTRDGRVVLEHNVDGKVRFFGDNLRATNKVAHNAVKALKQSTLPQPAASIAQPASGKELSPAP